jgi:hypothetical protein
MGMTPDMMQMGANLARQFKQDFMANQDRQERKDDRARMLRKENIAESDVNLLGQIASGNIKPMGGDEFMVPATEQDASQGLSGAGQLRLIDIKNAQEDRISGKASQALKDRLTNLQIAKAGKEDRRTQLVQKEDGSYALIDLDTGKETDTGVIGKTNKDFNQARAKIEILDKKLNSIRKKYDDDISDPETVLMEKAKSGDAIAKKDLLDYQRYSQESDNLTQKMIGGEPAQPSQTKTPIGPGNRPPLSIFGSQPDKKPMTVTDPKEISQAPEQYSNAQIKDGYVWATDKKGQSRRLFKAETPEVKYGNKTYPNRNYDAFLKKLESLGIKQ